MRAETEPPGPWGPPAYPQVRRSMRSEIFRDQLQIVLETVQLPVKDWIPKPALSMVAQVYLIYLISLLYMYIYIYGFVFCK